MTPPSAPNVSSTWGAKFPDTQSEIIDDAVEFLTMELAVGIIENDGFGDAQNFARGEEFLATKLGKLAIGLSGSAIGSRLARRETNDGGLRAAVAIEAKASAEVAGFIIGMRGYDHQAKHAEIVADMHEVAEIVQSLAGGRNYFGKSFVTTRMNEITRPSRKKHD